MAQHVETSGGFDIEAIAEEGYLPVAIDLRQQRLALRRLAGDRFHEPFFDQTASDWRSRPSIDIPLEGFVGAVANAQWNLSSNLILHTGRCGSTLLANLLGLRSATLVLKEPAFLNAAVVCDLHTQGSRESGMMSILSTRLLKYSARVANVQGRQLVVKASSWTAPWWLSIAQHEFDFRLLLMWQDPFSVVASELSSPPAWITDNRITSFAAQLGVQYAGNYPLTRDNLVVLFAAVWRTIVKAFLTAGTDWNRSAFLAFDSFTTHTLQTLLEVEAWFRIGDPSSQPDGFEETAARYSKSGAGEQYDPRGVHYRAPLSERDRARVAEMTKTALSGLHRITALPGTRVIPAL